MAEKIEEAKKEPQHKEKEAPQKAEKPAVAPKKVAVETYPVSELIANYKAFNASKAIVATALKLSKAERLSLEEAKKIIETFRNKEVK